MSAISTHMLLLVISLFLTFCSGQLTLPTIKVQHAGCSDEQIKTCRMECPPQYKDERRYLCPCYSKLSQCLVENGCSMRQKVSVMQFCTHKGYCKDGYCKYRAGDLQPKGDVREEVFEETAVKAPGTPCVDNCCPTERKLGLCAEDKHMKALRVPGRRYRRDEVNLPPRQGDPRLSVNQNYNRMPYSIPLENLP